MSTFDASNQPQENNILSLPEGCHWTILSAEKKNFTWTGNEEDIVFPEFDGLEVIYVRLAEMNHE